MKATYFIALATALVYLAGNPEWMWLWAVDSGEFRPVQLFTYALCHAGLLHLTVNLLALVSFGPALERAWGRATFVVVYVVCVAGAGLLLQLLASDHLPVMGASGALFGVFAAYTWQNPQKRVISLFLVPLRAWHVLVGYVVLSGLALAFQWLPGVAHLAHMGGASVGLVAAAYLGLRRKS